MKRFYQILTLIFFVPALAMAQQQNKQTFTLEECIQYALQNSVNAKNAILDQEIAENVILERKSAGLPQISGNVTLTDNIKLSRFFSTYNPGGTSFTGDLSTVPGIKAGDVVMFKKWGGTEVKIEGKEYLFVKFEDVLAIETK